MALGAYAVERDYSHYTAYLSRTVLAVVGTATKGPIGVATVCTSTQDFVNKFGPLKTNYYGLYAGQYFLSQSSKLYYVRAASASAAEATLQVSGVNTGATAVVDAITFKMKEKGSYGNGYSIVLTSTDDTYTIVVKNAAGVTLETLTAIDLEDLTTTYTTNYVKISAVNATAVSLTAGTYSFSGGDDGADDIAASDYITAASTLAAESVDMNLVSVPGISDASLITSMLTLAENRGDCLYLVDPPAGLTRDGVINWHNGDGDYAHAAFNSSFGALYYDWVTIYDSVNKVKVQVPPSVPVAATIAYSDRTSELWYAPAGLNRGVIRGVLEPVTRISKADVNLLYSADNNINSIYEDPQVGLVIWGQKTLYRNDTSLNRINVRKLLNYLKKVVTASCNYLVFEPNDRVTWNSFEMSITPLLEKIKDHRGIYEYSIVRGETIVSNVDIDNYRMPCMIMIRPTKAAEEIPIYFVLTSSGAEFNDVLETNGVV